MTPNRCREGHIWYGPDTLVGDFCPVLWCGRHRSSPAVRMPAELRPLNFEQYRWRRDIFVHYSVLAQYEDMERSSEQGRGA